MQDEDPSLLGFYSILTWVINSKDVVPIALYVSLEICQMAQAIFISWDKKMSVMVEGKFQYARAQTSRLNEQLAQIQYIFSDKTGTLTQNSMEFKKSFIGQVRYGSGTTMAGVISKARAKGEDMNEAILKYNQQLERDRTTRGFLHDHVEFNQEDIINDALIPYFDKTGASADEIDEAQRVYDYILNLGINNTIFPKPLNKTDDTDWSDPKNGLEFKMQSSSPDETSLTYFAQFLGFELYTRQGGIVTMRMRNPKTKELYFEKYKEVLVLNFSSKRKRMTLILQKILDDSTVDDELIIFCKGADSFVKKLMDVGLTHLEKQKECKGRSPPSLNSLEQNWQETLAYLTECGGESLRCLVVASARRHPSWFYGGGEDDAKSLQNRYGEIYRNQGPSEKGHDYGGCDKDCKMCQIEFEIETTASLDLNGVTAIEDKLQDGVPECLQTLLDAGINVWVLTGDNVETAVNIGVSCNLLDGHMEAEGRLFKFDNDVRSLAALQKRLDLHTVKCDELLTRLGPNIQLGVALHGDVWKLILEADDMLKDQFFKFASRCKSVIACRLEPKEKADIVTIVKGREGCSVLAIGDGNNDAPMIKVADVGVGIRGVEGTSAVAVADYAISRFRFLSRLMLVHGHWSARRTSFLVLFIYYKATMLVLTVVLFGFYSGFSGQMLISDWAYQCHNLVFTSLPIIVLTVFDQDISEETLIKFPKIYSMMRGPKGPTILSIKIFLQWQAVAIIQTLIVFFIPWTAYDTPQQSNGHAQGCWTRGAAVYSCLVAVICNHLLLRFASWTWIHHLFQWGMLAFFVGVMAILSMRTEGDIFELAGISYSDVFNHLWHTPLYWLVLTLTLATAWLVDFVYIIATRVVNPTDIEIIVEAERLKILPVPAVNEEVRSPKSDNLPLASKIEC